MAPDVAIDADALTGLADADEEEAVAIAVAITAYLQEQEVAAAAAAAAGDRAAESQRSWEFSGRRRRRRSVGRDPDPGKPAAKLPRSPAPSRPVTGCGRRGRGDFLFLEICCDRNRDSAGLLLVGIRPSRELLGGHRCLWGH